MRRTRRVFLSVLVIALLLGSLIVPFTASADSGTRFNAKGWVSPDTTCTIGAGGVSVTIPAGAVSKSGPINVHVTVTEDGVTAVFVPPYEFDEPVTLTFPDGIAEIVYVKGNTVEILYPDQHGVFFIDHFSRYSGWF